MFNIFKNRYLHVLVLIILLFYVLISYLHKITVVEHQKYAELSLQNRIRKVEIPAKRGEITDRKGNVLAYNEVCYSVKLNASLIPKDCFAEQCIQMYDFFKAQGEKQVEFPIFIENGEYKYRFDEDIKEWLVRSGYGEDWSARQVFEYEKAKYFIDENLSDYEAMNLLFSRSLYLPISTIDMKFNDQVAKEQFLDFYGLEYSMSAEDAFHEIRQNGLYKIPEELSDEDAYKVLVYRHLITNKGHLEYEPIEIVEQASLETSVLVAEQAYRFPGLYTDFTTKRIYTSGDLASHIVGYIGKIATVGEVQEYVDEKGYNRNDYIGKTGIEYVMEDTLHGKAGFKYIEADAVGRYIDDIDAEQYGLDIEKQSTGSDIVTTIDLAFQQKIKDSIEVYLEHLRTGTPHESKWGSYTMRKNPSAVTAAVVVADVNSGKILGSYSYPSFDSMVFMKGITKKDWEELNPKNPSNPLSPRPLIDLTATMAVAPGSTYKMMTGYAAIRQGLDPYMKIYADGNIKLGEHSFGCWLWNEYGGRHGPIDFPMALKESCNYYFFCVANGKDYHNNTPLNYYIDNNILIETSKLFGFDDPTGAEIPEFAMGVPDANRKVETSLALLSAKLEELLPKYFSESQLSTAAKRKDIIDTIVSWAEENPSRGELIDRLYKLGSSKDYLLTEEFADIIKYDYFNMMDWNEGDTMNLAIGQGKHAYTPLQMARYIAIIANGGRPIEFTYIDSIDGKPYDKNKDVVSFDTEGDLKYVQEAMYKMANDPASHVRGAFGEFPITVAGKTGTAEKEGLVPPDDEAVYIYDNLYRIAPYISAEELENEATRILKSRSEEMTRLEREIKELEESGEQSEELEELRYQFATSLTLDRLRKGDALREALKTLSNGRVSDDDIDRYRPEYGTFSWFMCYAPYEEPEIAVAVLVPQGGQGHNAALLARDVIAAYYGLDEEEMEETQDTSDVAVDE